MVIIDYISDLPQSLTQILRFTFHHNIYNEVPARLLKMEMGVCLQERGKNFVFLKLSFVFKETALCKYVLDHSKLLKQPKRGEGGVRANAP